MLCIVILQNSSQTSDRFTGLIDLDSRIFDNTRMKLSIFRVQVVDKKNRRKERTDPRISGSQRSARTSHLCRKICKSVAGRRAPSSSIIPYRSEYPVGRKPRGKNRLETVDPLPVLLRPCRSLEQSPGSFPRIRPRGFPR